MPIELLKDDCGTVELEADSFDACLTDPPYFLEFMNKDWDKAKQGAYQAHLKWTKNIFRALKPGAYILAFSGTRTSHHLARALEDAGFELRDTLIWLYAQGMPKGIATLKPAYEPILLARKPLVTSLKETIAASGLGGLNIDSCRILKPANDNDSGWSKSGSKASDNQALSGPNMAREPKPDAAARWPSNVLLDEEAAKLLDASTKATKSTPYKENVASGSVLPLKKRTAGGYSDSGGVSRFFYCSKATKKDRNTNGAENDHATVKPTKLTEYLAKLILPPTDEPKLLVPFAGSGSEIIGAKKAGWKNITGIEIDQHYIKIAKKRLGL